jgi:threonyl-tRNA synthetase
MTTARELLAKDGNLAADVVAVRVNGRIVDLMTPLVPDARYEVVRETEPDGLKVIRHSSAHVLADAVQRLFPGTKVAFGPAIEDGFYYDFDRPDGHFSDEDLAKIERTMLDIIRKNTPFRREELSREEAAKILESKHESFKLEHLRTIPANEAISVYRHGTAPEEWIDLCEGPHVPSTGKLAAIKLTSVAGAYWRGDERNPMLQRIYGTAFPSKAALDEHLRLLEEAKKRDHRKLGKELDLFMFHEYAPAVPFLLPRGAFVYNRLVDYLRSLYLDYGYEEVLTPQIFDTKLFVTSGHMANYADNMYRVFTEEMLEGAEASVSAREPPPAADARTKAFADALRAAATGVKPMNCPSHCLIFGSRRRSYRELPWRVADFGRLHRFERGGVVHGLARVRSFCQDDAHIFCAEEDIQKETDGFISLLFEVYGALGMNEIDIKLATRPEKRIGNDALWDRAERTLAQSLTARDLTFEYLPGEGAFYGPKLEFHVKDALKRSWQLGTIQLDYALPERFELEFTGADGAAHRPVMLHRAILGSLERFLSVYIEHVAGAFPVWLAPEQVALVTVSEKQLAYGEQAAAFLRSRGLRVITDFGADKLGAKIRNARLMRHPYIAVIGDKEAESRSVSPRSQVSGELGAMSLEAFADRLTAEAIPPRPQKTSQ